MKSLLIATLLLSSLAFANGGKAVVSCENSGEFGGQHSFDIIKNKNGKFDLIFKFQLMASPFYAEYQTSYGRNVFGFDEKRQIISNLDCAEVENSQVFLVCHGVSGPIVVRKITPTNSRQAAMIHVEGILDSKSSLIQIWSKTLKTAGQKESKGNSFSYAIKDEHCKTIADVDCIKVGVDNPPNCKYNPVVTTY